MDGWDEYLSTCGPKESVYLGHCAAHSEESSNGEEGNALNSQPQLLDRGLVLQQVVQLYVVNLSLPFSSEPSTIRVLHFLSFSQSVSHVI